MDSCNQVSIHFADLASTKFTGKLKLLKSLNLVITKLMHIKVYLLFLLLGDHMTYDSYHYPVLPNM